MGRALRLLQPLVVRQRLFGAGDTGAGGDKSLPVYKCPAAAPAAAPSEDAPRQQVQESGAQSETGQCRSYTCYLTIIYSRKHFQLQFRLQDLHFMDFHYTANFSRLEFPKDYSIFG